MADQLQETEQVEDFTEETPVETQNSEVEEPEQTAPVEDTDSEDGEVIKSERGQKRVQELANKANKAKELEQEVKNLKERLYDEPDDENQDILERLKRDSDVPYTGDYVQDLKLAEERASRKAIDYVSKIQAKRDRFMSDVNQLENEYPELRKGSEQFDENFTDELVTLYKEASNVNPNLRLKPFVDRIMKLSKKSESKGKTSSVEELVRQEQESAVTPTTRATRTQKEFKDMTFEEIEELAKRQQE